MNTATSLNLLYGIGGSEFATSAERQLELTAAAGFRYIDMNFWDWGHKTESPFNSPDWKTWLSGIKTRGEQLGVRFHQAHAMVYNPWSGDSRCEFLADVTRRCIIGAGMLGIDWIVFHAADIAGATESENRERNIEWLTPYVSLARECGVGIAIENMNKIGRYTSSTDELVALIDSFDPKIVGACWDTGHGHMTGSNQYDDVVKLGRRLKVLHVQDNDGKTDGHTAPFYGTIDWEKLLRGLHDVKYAGEFTFEAHMIVRRVPDACKPAAVKLLFDIGEYLTGEFNRL